MQRLSHCLFIVLLALVGTAEAATTLKIATISPDGSAWMTTMRKAGKAIEAETEGRVRFKWYPGGVMGDDTTVLRKIRIGQLHGAATTMGALSKFYPDSQAYNVPFLFEGYDEVDHVREQLDDSLVEGFRNGGMTVLGLAEGGFAYLLSKAPIHSPEALKDHKVWVPTGDTVNMRLANSMGFTPIPLGIGDVLPSLQTDLINAITSSPVAAIGLQWHTQVKYIVDLPLLYFCAVLSVKNSAFDRISDADQAVIQRLMGEAFASIEAQTRRDNEAAFQALQQQGIQRIELQSDVIRRWRSVKGKGEELLISDGGVSQQAVEQINQLVENYRGSNAPGS